LNTSPGGEGGDGDGLTLVGGLVVEALVGWLVGWVCERGCFRCACPHSCFRSARLLSSWSSSAHRGYGGVEYIPSGNLRTTPLERPSRIAALFRSRPGQRWYLGYPGFPSRWLFRRDSKRSPPSLAVTSSAWIASGKDRVGDDTSLDGTGLNAVGGASNVSEE
jgi:hypothetical protein